MRVRFPWLPLKGKWIMNVPGFKLVKGNDRYATSADGRIWHKSHRGGWQPVKPYKFCTGEWVVRMQRSGGMSVYTVGSVLAGAPQPPGHKG